MENRILHTEWTLRIQSNALQSSQCTRYIPSNDEYNFTGIPGPRSSRIIR